jgi:phosphomevalonate kinase
LSDFTVFAPGKLVLVGEYAVLDGEPAIVLAINRGVRCDVSLGGSKVEIETPDGDTRFVAPALASAAPGRYRFAAWNPVDLPSKPGFGGSAAACVAACIAAGRPAQDAREIHRHVQGSGSGVDVLASIHGGMGSFRAGTWTPLRPVVPVVTFTGQSAKTGPRVQQYQAWSATSRAAFRAESRSASDRFAAEPLDSMQRSRDLLFQMTTDAGIDYATPAIVEIDEVARLLGGVAKPSGAGGGDCTVALFPNVHSAAEFTRQVEARGYPCISIEPAPGARRVTL